MVIFKQHIPVSVLTGMVCAILFCGSVGASGLPDAELKKINHLINTVSSLDGYTFIRNGSRHTCREASEHMRLKFSNARKYIHSAEDFIDKCATQSSFSGKPYYIETPGGVKTLSGVFLRTLLKESTVP